MNIFNASGHLAIVAILAAACSSGETTPISLSFAATCATDADCDDNTFCNGVEKCTAVTGTEGTKYCRPGAPVCVGEECNERTNSCDKLPCADADGDGHESSSCGGDDCDDRNAARFPGATEVCNAVDEDCNDTTYGPDADGDGEVSTACCNGTGHCGTDCNDQLGGVYSTAVEVCNGADDDCDGVIDDGVMVTSYADADGDGYGVEPAVQKCAGTRGYSTLGNDCDDTNPAITPGVMRCDLATVQLLNDIETCTSKGTFTGGVCSGNATCRVQPNGTGVCI